MIFNQCVGKNGDEIFKSLVERTIETISFPEAITIDQSAFRGCTQLNSIYLMGSSISTLVNNNAFNDSPFANGTGKIYVPANLVSAYQSAQNWSTYASQFMAI